MNKVKEYAEVHGSTEALKEFGNLLKEAGIERDMKYGVPLYESGCIVTYTPDSSFENGSFVYRTLLPEPYTELVFKLPEDKVKAMQAIIETI